MKRSKPPFRADHVGSLLRPEVIKEARQKFADGKIDAGARKAVEDQEIVRVIKKQEDAGLQAVTDGEFRRSWWHLDYLWGLDGCERYIMDQGMAFSGMNTRAEGVRCTSKVTYSTHPMIDHFRFVQANTDRLAKISIPAPSAIYGRTGRKALPESVYPELEEFFDDLGAAYAKSVRDFADNGCRYLQLDEVFIAMACDEQYREGVRANGDDPQTMTEKYADGINAAMSDIPDDMTITMHLCRGNYRSTFMGSGGYEPVADILFNRINVHGYFMEYDTDRAGGFEPLRLVPKDRIVVLGLVTSKSGAMESRADVLRRIEEAAKFIDIDQLCLSSQCGFASSEEGNTLSEDEQWKKLEFIVSIAEEVWG